LLYYYENFASIHAYLCADGYVIKNPSNQNKKYYTIGFRNTNLILLRDFQNKFYRLFGIKPYLIEGQRCRLGSKEIYKQLTNQFGSFYSWEWKMPKLNNGLLRFWLRSYFDCEGWVTCKTHQNRMIGVDCVNEKGIKQIKKALKRLDIESKLNKRNNRNIFTLNIFGKENLIKFNNKIGFLHSKKCAKLKESINDFIVYDWVYPNGLSLIKFVKEILRTKAKIKKPIGSVRILSNVEKNLLRLKKELYRLFKIKSKINKYINGIGTPYYELSIHKKQEIKYLIDHDLINKEQKKKWLSLRK